MPNTDDITTSNGIGANPNNATENQDGLIAINADQIITAIERLFSQEKSINKSNHFPDDDTVAKLRSSLVKLVIELNNYVTIEHIDLSKLIEEPLLSKLPVFQPTFKEFQKKQLDAYPPLFQLIVLLHYLGETTKENQLKKQWLLLILLIAIRLKIVGLKSYYKTIILRIKLAIFSNSPNYQWIWRVLQSEPLDKIDFENTSSAIEQFTSRLKQTADNYLHQMLILNDAKVGEKRSRQLHYIAKAIQLSFYKGKRQRAKIERDDEQHEQNQQQAIKEFQALRDRNSTPSQSAQALVKPVFERPLTHHYHWDKPPFDKDLENTTPDIQTQFLLPNIDSNAQTNITFEEAVENAQQFLTYQDRPSASIAHNPPLQSVELTLQQLYISRRDFRFNTDTHALSQWGYQVLFNRLAFDALVSQASELSVAHKNAAKLLLLSFITAMPIKTLIQPLFIATSSLFTIQKTQVTLSYHLGITPRKIEQSHLEFENNSDKVSLPLPVALVHHLANSDNLPNIEADISQNKINEIADYLKVLRESLELPYLSINRIEMALATLLTRYLAGSHGHIAELVCRMPAPDAPAMYYSSHANSEIVEHYIRALKQLNTQNHLMFNYSNRRTDVKVGSAFALTLDSVKTLLEKVQKWVDSTSDFEQLFNRLSCYVWLVFCVLTGIRPNNALGEVRDIDLEVGWIMVKDKPNKKVQNHRLIPLCDTLIKHLIIYQKILAILRTQSLDNPAITARLHRVTFDDADITLLNLLSEKFDKLHAIKRGNMNAFLQDFIELDVYWTRHFVRTQLEKRQVPIHLINTVIGHEKNQQEALGKFSSTSKKQVHDVRHTFEHIATDLALDNSIRFLEQQLHQLKEK
ncbi:hypothetical protein GCM10010099_23170 [Streptomyces cinereus]|nr:hypothetical protein GCM10010099_23170 [Streptomyces cinereus]